MSNQLSRRAFARRITGRDAAPVEPVADPASRPFPPGKYLDFHVHVGQRWATNREALSAGAIVQWMDANDISQAVVHPLINPESLDHMLTTDFVLEQTLPYRDRLIPFAVVDPRTPFERWGTSAVELLKRYVAAGARGFGEHKPGLAIDDPRNMKIYEACAELDLCVMFHLESNRNMDEVGLPGLERVLQAFPTVNFAGHGPGFWASISGDMQDELFSSYPKTPVTPGGAVPTLMAKYPNLYGDLSSGSGGNALTRDIEHGREFVLRFADQLLWATDYLHPNWNARQLVIFPSLDLPPDVEAKIYRDNGRRLLKLI